VTAHSVHSIDPTEVVVRVRSVDLAGLGVRVRSADLTGLDVVTAHSGGRA